jgi:VanZ family protein
MKALFLFLKNHSWIALILAVLWTLLIMIACFLPARDIPKVKIAFIDKCVHFIIFGGFSFLWMFRMGKFTFKTGLWTLLLSFLFGVFVELIQGSGLVRGRSFEYLDILADTTGAIIGLLLFFYSRKRSA